MARGKNDTFDEEHREECLTCPLPCCINCFQHGWHVVREEAENERERS